MTRRSRILAALVAAAALLFTQLAGSAFACRAELEGAAAMAQMQHDMDGDDAGLCQHRCASGGKLSFEAAKPSLASMPALAPANVLRVALAEPAPWRTAVRAAPLSVTGPEPPLVRFSVLRI